MVRRTRALPRVVVFNAVKSWLNTPQEGSDRQLGRIWIVSEPPRDAEGKDGKGHWRTSGMAGIWVDQEELIEGNWNTREELGGDDWTAISNEEWVIVAVYRHQRKNPAETAEWWADIMAKTKANAWNKDKAILIAGDFNAEHDLWLGNEAQTKPHSERRNPLQGEEIAAIATTAEMYAVIDRKHPYTRTGKGRPSALDVIWTSHRVPGTIDKTWGSSDHAYLSLGGDQTSHNPNAPKQKTTAPAETRTHVDARKARNEIAACALINPPPKKGLWVETARICEANRKTRLTNPSASGNWWNAELELLRKVAHKSAKRSADRPGCTKRRKDCTLARGIFRRAMRKAKREYQEERVQSLIGEERSAILAFYQERDRILRADVSALRGSNPTPQIIGESEAQTANRLQRHNFPEDAEEPSHPREWNTHRPPSPDLWTKVNKDLAGKSAAGPDKLTTKMVRRLFVAEEIEDALAAEMLEAWTTGTPRLEWRQVRIKYVPKPGRKAWTEAATWRPIGVINTAGKIYSAGVAKDIQSQIRWAAPVFGATKGVGCVDIALRHANLINHVSGNNNDGRRAIQKPTLVGVYFDVKSAFPGTKRTHLTEALEAHPEIQHWARDIETRADRRLARVEWEGMTETNRWELISGLDQGDPASPVLWQLVMERVLLSMTQPPPDTNNGPVMELMDAYVDDGFIGKIGLMSKQEVHATIGRLAACCKAVKERWGFTLPPEKMEVVIKGRFPAKSIVAMGWPEGLPPPQEKTVTRLGIPIPVNNKWHDNSHLSKRIAMMQSKAALIRRMGNQLAWDMDTILAAAVAILLPTVAYGCELWEKGSTVENAEREWYRAIKGILGWHGKIKRTTLFLALAIPSVEEYRLHLRRRATIRILKNPDHPARHSPTSGITDAMAGEWLPSQATPPEMTQSSQTGWSSHPLATKATTESRKVGTDEGMSWEDWTNCIVNDAITEEGRKVVFSDASVLDDGRAGAGWVDATGGGFLTNADRAPLGKGMTSGDAETLACSKAYGGRPGRWLVLTDSTTAIDALTGPHNVAEREVAEARRNGVDVQIGWIKGHADIPGNEKADSEAKAAAESQPQDIPMTRFTTAWARKEDTKKWNESKTDPFWGEGRVRTWNKASARTLLRTRQATSKCPLCEHDNPGNNITRHVMIECEPAETLRIRTKLYNPARPDENRGYAGWDSWLSAEEHRNTEAFLKALAKAWSLAGALPEERGCEPYGDRVMMGTE